MRTLDKTALREPAPTQIRIPDLVPTLEITFELDGPDVVLRAMVVLTAPIHETFPADLTVGGIFPPVGPAIILEKDEWLPAEGPEALSAADIIQAAIDGCQVVADCGTENIDEYLRRHAEDALNDVCTSVRRDMWECEQKKAAS